MQTEQDLEKLVRAYTPPLLRYCTALLGSEADAQDAVQTTFVKAWLHRHRLRGGGQDNERAWLYRIAYRTALDMLRAARRASSARHPNRLRRPTPASAKVCGMPWARWSRWTGRWCWSGCWTAWTTPPWRRSITGRRVTCAPATTGPKENWPHFWKRRDFAMTPDRDETLLRRALQEGLHPAETDLWPAVAQALPAGEKRQKRRTRALRLAVCIGAPLLLAAGALLGRVQFTNLRTTPRPSFAPENNTGYAIQYDQTAYELPDKLMDSLMAHYNDEWDADGVPPMHTSCGGRNLPPKYGPGGRGYDSWADLTEATGLPLLRNDLLDSGTPDNAVHLIPDSDKIPRPDNWENLTIDECNAFYDAYLKNCGVWPVTSLPVLPWSGPNRLRSTFIPAGWMC